MSNTGLLVIFSGFLIHFTIGISVTFGNVLPYLVSYCRKVSGPPNLRYTDAAYVFSAMLVGWGASTLPAGLLERKFGPRLVNAFGGFLLTTGSFASYFAIQYNYWFLLLTFGLAFGIGCGISYMCPVTCTLKWYPDYKGVISGIISGGFAFSGAVVPFVQTFYINPKDYEPNESNPSYPDEKYFTDKDLLDRVPDVFLIIGGICAAFQLMGTILLQDPKPHTPPLLRKTKCLPAADDEEIETSMSSKPENTGSSENNAEATEKSPLLNPSKTSSEPQASPLIKQTLKKMLSNPMFYWLYLLFTFSSLTRVFITALYKAFGLEEVANNDVFMTIVLVVASIFNMIGRPIWGLLADKISYKFAFVLLSAMMSIFICTLYATSAVHEIMYLFWISGINFGIGGYFAIFPVAVSDVFGPSSVGVVYGIVYTGQAFGSVAAALLSQFLFDTIDWYGAFFVLGGIEIISFAVVLLFFPDNKKKKTKM